MKLCLVFGIVMFGLLASVTSQANPQCTAVLHQVLKDMMTSETEDSILKEFAPSNIISAKNISVHGNVFAVNAGSKGRTYIVRLEGDFTNVTREGFAVDLARTSPLKSVPKISIVDRETLPELKNNLERKLLVHKVGIQKSKDISISVFYDAKQGESFIHEYMTKGNLDVAIETTGSTDPTKIAKAWAIASPPEQMRFAHDVKTIFPEAGPLGLDETMYFFNRHATRETYEKMMVLLIKRIPSDIRRQLSDSWLLFSALGLPDFHCGNFLVHEKTVLPIDLGYKPDFSWPEMIPGQVHHPYSRTRMAHEHVLRLLLADSSPEMRQFLQSLTVEKLKEIASKSHYTLKSEEPQFILDRIKNLLDLGSPKP